MVLHLNCYSITLDIVEGDIVLDDNTAALLRGGARNAMANVNKWPKGVVPYVLDSSVGKFVPIIL